MPLVKSRVTPSRLPSAILVAVLLAAPVARAAAPGSDTPFDLESCWIADESGAQSLDAQCFFDRLVQRYRGLTTYHDVARVTQVTSREGRPPQRIVRRIGCEIEDGRLSVQTPASRVGRGLGLHSVAAPTPQLEQALLDYHLWLAPHMGLKYTAEPESGAHDGLKVAGAAVTEGDDDKRMVRLELKTEATSSQQREAKVDLYVNLDSLLVERIESRERMPDGAQCATTMEITPIDAETGEAEKAVETPEPETAPAPRPAVYGPPGDPAPSPPPDPAGAVPRNNPNR